MDALVCVSLRNGLMGLRMVLVACVAALAVAPSQHSPRRAVCTGSGSPLQTRASSKHAGVATGTQVAAWRGDLGEMADDWGEWDDAPDDDGEDPFAAPVGRKSEARQLTSDSDSPDWPSSPSASQTAARAAPAPPPAPPAAAIPAAVPVAPAPLAVVAAPVAPPPAAFASGYPPVALPALSAPAAVAADAPQAQLAQPLSMEHAPVVQVRVHKGCRGQDSHP
jgi:hypothetical protein